MSEQTRAMLLQHLVWDFESAVGMALDAGYDERDADLYEGAEKLLNAMRERLEAAKNEAMMAEEREEKVA